MQSLWERIKALGKFIKKVSPSLFFMGFVWPSLLSTLILVLENTIGLDWLGSLINATKEDSPSPTLVWPIVWIYGFFLGLYGLGVATRRNDINELGQWAERYTEAANQLEKENIIVRESGLYALENLAKGAPSEGEKEQIKNLLASFVRITSPVSNIQKGIPQGNPADVVAAVRMLSRIANEKDRHERKIDLSMTNLGSADLHHLNLSWFNFQGSRMLQVFQANLSHALLANTDLSGANLSLTNCSHAQIYHANLSHTNLLYVNLCYTNLSDVNFFNTSFNETSISDSSFARALNLHQWQIDNSIYEDGKPPRNLPNGLNLKADKRMLLVRDRLFYRFLLEEDREKRP